MAQRLAQGGAVEVLLPGDFGHGARLGPAPVAGVGLQKDQRLGRPPGAKTGLEGFVAQALILQIAAFPYYSIFILHWFYKNTPLVGLISQLGFTNIAIAKINP